MQKKKNFFTLEKSTIPVGFFLYHTNMAVVTSCENGVCYYMKCILSLADRRSHASLFVCSVV